MKIKCIPCGMLQANCYIVEGENSAVVIDPGYIEPGLVSYVSENKGKIKYILLTHRHFDHTYGAVALRKMTDAKIVVSAADECGIYSDELSLAKMVNGAYGMADTLARADILVSEGDTITVDELEFKVIETPGHSPGGVCYITDEAVFSGDTLFAGSIGRTDFPFSSHTDMLQALKRLKELPDSYTVYSGHGGVTTIGEEKNNNIFMLEV